jgi:transmembrane sensor
LDERSGMNEANESAQAVEAEAAQWLARQHGERWNPGLQRELDAWISADLRHRLAYLRLHAAWERADALSGQAVARPVARPVVRPVVRPFLQRFPIWRQAAGVLLACGLAATLVPRLDWRQGERYATRTGENRTIALADGSRLTLNTATRLRTAPDGQRKVWLDGGEAYFDIAHDPSHPFVVEAGSSRVTVLGTRFTVRRDGDSTRVLVEQGRVGLSEHNASVQVGRNQEATAEAGRITRTEVGASRTAQRLAWRQGRIVFDQTTLGVAAAEFNRYNDRKLVIADPAAAGILIGGSFAPSNVDGFVRLLEQGFGLHAKRGSDEIVITQ